MKSLKTIRESVDPKELPTLVEFAGGGADMPVILVAKRKAIRSFPDGQIVGLYYIKQIDRFITIPSATMFGISEAKSTVSKKEDAINDVLSRHSAGTLNKQQASRLLKTLGVLNPGLLLGEAVEEGVATAKMVNTHRDRKAAVRAGRQAGAGAKAKEGPRSTLAGADKEEKPAKGKKAEPEQPKGIVARAKARWEKEKKDTAAFKGKNVAQKIGKGAGDATKWVAGKTVGKAAKAAGRGAVKGAKRVGGLAKTAGSAFKAGYQSATQKESVMEMLQYATENESITSITLPDGTDVNIDYATASSILEVFNNLNEENQSKMMDKMQTEDGFETIREFSLNG